MTAPKCVEIMLDSGVKVYVTPLSRYQLTALQAAARERYPCPDKAAYTLPMPEGVGIPGAMIPAEDNDEYQTLYSEAERLQSEFILTAMMDMCVTFADFKSREEVVGYFAAFIAQQRQWMTLPDDEWLATWRFAVVRSASDEELITAVVKDLLPITEVEITDEMRLFRPSVSWQAVRRLVKARQSSGT